MTTPCEKNRLRGNRLGADGRSGLETHHAEKHSFSQWSLDVTYLNLDRFFLDALAPLVE